MRILLAIDDSECSEAATRAVIAHFPREGTEVLVLHADEWPNQLPTSLPFVEGPTAAAEVLDVRDERRRQGEELVARTAQRLQSAGFRANTTVREGDARDAILDAAAQWSSDVIVLGSHGRKGVTRFLLGSVSETIVRHAPCSVEVVRAK
jgi:nucleotide-binding universal stress UspA family protein